MGAAFSTPKLVDADLNDLTGKVAIVTGGGSGAGYGAVLLLARRGAKVYIAARNESRALGAITQLTNAGLGTGSVDWIYVDLLDPRTAKKCAEDFTKKEKRLDILVNNASLGAYQTYTQTQDGIRDSMVTAHVSHFVLTTTLLPLLEKTSQEASSDVRVVNLSSPAYEVAGKVETIVGKEALNKDFGDSVAGRLKTYGYAKLANILFTTELQRRVKASEFGKTIICIAVNPGGVMSPGVEKFFGSIPVLGGLFKMIAPLVFKTPEAGGVNSTWAACSKKAREQRDVYGGAFINPVGEVIKLTVTGGSEQLAKELWETTEAVLQELGV